VAKTRHLPWVSFRPEVLRLAGICDEVRIECEPQEVWKKMVEAAKSKIKTETAGGGRTAPEEAGRGPPESPGQDGAETASRLNHVGGGAAGLGVVEDIASGRNLQTEIRHGGAGQRPGKEARGGLDPAAVAAVLKAVERCLGREAVERLTACLYV
jgi:hypothetical protein